MAKSTRSKRVKKPKKPHPDFPLFPHATRRWAKKIGGKLWYFGPWDKPQEALTRYLTEKDDILAGRDPRARKTEAYTLGKLCNEFVNAKKAALDRGQVTAQHFRNLFEACERLVAFFGGGKAAEAIGPDDFERFGNSFPSTWKLRRRKREVGAVRSVFSYGVKQEKLVRTRFGTFQQPTKKELTVERQIGERKHGNRDFTPKQLRTIIDAAPIPLKAMVLLGVNVGYGNTDCSTLPLAYVDLDAGFISYPRPKTAVERRAALWAETCAVLREAVARRPPPASEDDAGLVFLTVNGLRWVRSVTTKDDTGKVKVQCDDSVQKAFRALLKSLGLYRPGLSFYTLRHCCETHGGTDQIAIDRVMGHESPGMGSNYRQGIGDDRLRAVADAIHAWLFPPQIEADGNE
jgi:integrase